MMKTASKIMQALILLLVMVAVAGLDSLLPLIWG